jgi:GAF domain-containing protein
MDVAYITNAERLAALQRYDILDTPPDGTFDRVARIAARIFHVPIALVSLVDKDRIWFKAREGLSGVTEIPCAPGLCASVVCQDQTYLVTDALQDPRTRENPLVVGEFGLRFYAAAPLITHDGYRLGTVCVIDREPRPAPKPEELAILEDLAGIVIDQMEVRLAARLTLESLVLAEGGTDNLAHPEALITICAWSKKVRIDGEWVSFEEFLERRFGMRVTHGISREAMRRALLEWKSKSAATSSAEATAAD